MKFSIIGTLFVVCLLSLFFADSVGHIEPVSPKKTEIDFNFKETIKVDSDPCKGKGILVGNVPPDCSPNETLPAPVPTVPVEPLVVYEAPVTTIPVQTPQEVPAGCWDELALQVGWPQEAIAHITHIIQRESGCNPAALADRPSTLDNSYGLLQINTYGSLWAGVQRLCGVSDRTELYDPATNLSCGLTYYDTMGWSPWGG